MKKLISILCIAAVLVNSAALTGCNSDNTASNSSNDPDSSSAVIDNSENSGNSESGNSESSVPEKPKPSGEATSIIGLDGEPVYTGEITDSVDDGDGEVTMTCGEFAYAYYPRAAVNFIENPELFYGDGEFYQYVGEPLPSDYGFIRVNVGDKIGGLTVKSAKSEFRKSPEWSDVYFQGSTIEFDGEIELTGFVAVTEESESYPGSGGHIDFYPDAASSVKIPRTEYETDFENDSKAKHYVNETLFGWYGDHSAMRLGNISDIDSELREGDRYVRVKVKVGEIKIGYGGVDSAKISSIEIVDG